jgi:hypothetical protein
MRALLSALLVAGAICALWILAARDRPPDSDTPKGPTDRRPSPQQPTPAVRIASASVDLAGDAAPEEIEIRADVELDAEGDPLWEDGHRWAVFVHDSRGEHRLVDEFVPQGRLSGWVVQPDSGRALLVVLRQSGTSGIVVRTFRADGEGYAAVDRVDATGRLLAKLPASTSGTAAGF